MNYLYRKIRSIFYLLLNIVIFLLLFPFKKESNLEINSQLKRDEVINYLLNEKFQKNGKYLEIGCDLNQTFSKIDNNNKTGIDPVRGGNLKLSSKEFFENYNKEFFDVVFGWGYLLRDGITIQHPISGNPDEYYNEYIEINAFITGAFAIGIISGAYSTEVFRGAIQSIDKGQFEAANVLGLSKFGKFFKIILPQTLRLAIPNLSNVWQITLKDTSLISVTGLVEIMRQSYIAAGSTRDPLFFYSFAAVLYLLLTFVSMKLINRLEVKYSRGY